MEEDKQAGLNKLATAAESFIKQERWSRRWTNLLKLAVITYFVVLITMMASPFDALEENALSDKYMAVIHLDGPIMPGTKMSANAFNPLLREAFEDVNAVAVVIAANSPGGSPVQSALINNEITRLKKLHDKPVYVVVEDMCASGCYYIAVAADKIYANEGSIIGSIGVRMDSFGFTGLMEKMGVENRSMHAGTHKAFINPFAEIDEAGVKFFKERILDRTHQQFIATVKAGRGDRLIENENTFTGLVWLGDEAVENGLIDGLGDLGYVKREVVIVDSVKSYETDKSVMEQLMGDISSEVSLRLFQSFGQLQ